MWVSWYNSEGYNSPTEHDGMLNILREEQQKRFRPLVYICSPYAGDVESNVEKARMYSRYAVCHHCIPITPHLLYPQFMDDKSEGERDLAMFFGIVLMSKCQEVWVFGKPSAGMQKEIERAKYKHYPLRYFEEVDGNIKEVTL